MELTNLNLTKTDLERIVFNHFNHGKNAPPTPTKWRVLEAKLEPFSPCPDGFLAEHYSLRVTTEMEIGQTEELSFFVKCAPVNNTALARYLKEIGSFHKETHVLGSILTVIQGLCPRRAIAPTVYFSRDLNLLVMNNLKADGYTVIKRENGLMDDIFLLEALETLACLHAGSLILEESSGKTLPELFPNVLDENAWVTVPTSTRVKDVANVIRLYSEFVKLCGKWQGSQEKTILSKIPELFRRIYSYTIPSTKYRNCLNHGDLWCNNVMFKCDSHGRPTGCILVDYQMSRYVPPAYDINLLLYLTTNRQQRDQLNQVHLSHYYDCFSQMLQQNNLSAADILPRDSFLESCENYRLAGLIHSAMISGEVTLPREYLEEVFSNTELTAGFMPDPKVNVCIAAFQANVAYRNHLLELMDELFANIPM